QNGFVALNTALFPNGVFLRIPAATKIDAPILLLSISDAPNEDAAMASFPRVLIVAEQDSDATLIESYVALDGSSYLNSTVTEVPLGERAQLRHFRIQRESQSAFHIATTKTTLGKHASYDATAINLGAALARHDIAVTMNEEGANCSIDGLYMIAG